MAQEQREKIQQLLPILRLHDEQEMVVGGGVHQSHSPFSAGQYLIKVKGKSSESLYIQAALVVNEKLWKGRDEQDPLEPLRLEHFYFGLGKDSFNSPWLKSGQGDCC